MTVEELLERDLGIYGNNFALKTDEGLIRIPPYEVTYNPQTGVYKWKGQEIHRELLDE